MVSPNEASFNLRESFPLSRNMLHSRELTTLADTGQRTNHSFGCLMNGYRDWRFCLSSPKVSTSHLIYLVEVRDTAKSGMGCLVIATYRIS